VWRGTCRCRPGSTPTCAAAPSTAASSSLSKKRERLPTGACRLITDRPFPRAAEAETGAGAAKTLPPDALIVMPVRGFVLFPGTIFPLTIGRDRSIRAAQQAVRDQVQLGVLMQRDPDVAEPQALDLHRIGTIANVVRYVTAPDGTNHLVCQGVQRFRVIEFLGGYPYLVARVNRIEDPE